VVVVVVVVVIVMVVDDGGDVMTADRWSIVDWSSRCWRIDRCTSLPRKAVSKEGSTRLTNRSSVTSSYFLLPLVLPPPPVVAVVVPPLVAIIIIIIIISEELRNTADFRGLSGSWMKRNVERMTS